MGKNEAKGEKAGKEEEKNKGVFGLPTSTLAIIAVVAIAAIALIYYGAMQRQGGGTVETPVPPLETEAAKLLLSSYDASMALSTYSLNYSTDEDGATSQYLLMDSGTGRFARVEGGFGAVEGYFAVGNETEDIACLGFRNQTKCTKVGNDTDTRGVADNIAGLFLSKSQRAEKKEFMRMLIEYGAAKPSKEVADEKVGPFEAKKASYSLSYKNVTVQQLLAMGISPDDQSIYAIDNYVMTFWVDKKTGLLVKSRETYSVEGASHVFATEYSGISLSAPQLPEKPAALSTPAEFLLFYSKSAQEYTSDMKCRALPKSEQDSCFKALAYERRDPEICGRISGKDLYENCVLILAQRSTSDLLCERLDTLKDECYIAIVAETGNADLCKKVQNQSLIEACADAVAAGMRKMDDVNQELLRTVSKQNCASGNDCMVAGKFGEFCVPKNTTLLPINENSLFYGCYANLSCGCSGGYCGFAKNESYYKCISDTEEEAFRSYIGKLIESKNNSTG